jgi:hypothetical protein
MKAPVVIVVASLAVAIVLMTSLLIAGSVKQSEAQAPVGRTLMAR